MIRREWLVLFSLEMREEIQILNPGFYFVIRIDGNDTPMDPGQLWGVCSTLSSITRVVFVGGSPDASPDAPLGCNHTNMVMAVGKVEIVCTKSKEALR